MPQEFIDSAAYPDPLPWPPIELLACERRLDEAVEVGRPGFDGHDVRLLKE
ncbi:hypothetical protein ABZ479_40425 [Streptomyces sp. NPDC005722]